MFTKFHNRKIYKFNLSMKKKISGKIPSLELGVGVEAVQNSWFSMISKVKKLKFHFSCRFILGK